MLLVITYRIRLFCMHYSNRIAGRRIWVVCDHRRSFFIDHLVLVRIAVQGTPYIRTNKDIVPEALHICCTDTASVRGITKFLVNKRVVVSELLHDKLIATTWLSIVIWTYRWSSCVGKDLWNSLIPFSDLGSTERVCSRVTIKADLDTR